MCIYVHVYIIYVSLFIQQISLLDFFWLECYSHMPFVVTQSTISFISFDKFCCCYSILSVTANSQHSVVVTKDSCGLLELSDGKCAKIELSVEKNSAIALWPVTLTCTSGGSIRRNLIMTNVMYVTTFRSVWRARWNL